MTYRNPTLREMMESPIPSISKQKRLPFRPSLAEAQYVYKLLNRDIFDNQLYMPAITLAARRRKYWGMCEGHIELQDTGSWCEIRLMDKWFSVQWFVTIIAHEMCHQYQWDIEGPKRYRKGKDFLMSHGPSFFKYRKKLKQHRIPLKTAHSMRRWFKHQDLFKA